MYPRVDEPAACCCVGAYRGSIYEGYEGPGGEAPEPAHAESGGEPLYGKRISKRLGFDLGLDGAEPGCGPADSNGPGAGCTPMTPGTYDTWHP